MSDVLISYDKSGYLADKASYNRIAEFIQTVANNYNSLGFGSLIASELPILFNSPIDFIFDKMTGGQPVTIGNITVNKQKAIEILNKPEGYEMLIAQIDEFGKKGVFDERHHRNFHVNKANIATVYTIDENGQVVIAEAFDLGLKSNNKKFAKTDTAKKMLQLSKTIVDKAKELGVSDLIHGNTISHIISGIDPRRGELSINVDGIVKYNQPGFSRH